jgi:hypothetical protein
MRKVPTKKSQMGIESTLIATPPELPLVAVDHQALLPFLGDRKSYRPDRAKP